MNSIITRVKAALAVFKRAATMLVAGIALNLAVQGSAHAQLAPLYNQLMDTLQQMAMNKLMAQMGVGVEGAVTQSGAATRSEILKGAMVNKSVAEGLEQYRQQNILQRQTLDLADSLKQPAQTCDTMAVQDGLGATVATSRARAGEGQKRVLKQLASNKNTVAVVEEAHKTSNELTCTPAEAARGICKINAANQALAGADQNAAFLFQGKDGSPTYDGLREGAQSKAVDGYISRVAAALPPQQLESTKYDKNPAGRAYVEMVRRFTAVSSMVSYSLNQIKELHTAQPGLGTSTTMADVTAGGFTGGKADMSILEVMQRFVAKKFSPDAMKDAATATNVNLILRDMAQTNAFQLWMEHQTLLQDQRTEALMAHQLALMTEQVLRPQLDAQRAQAARSVAVAR
ncbi:D-alanyl-D-alanine dipeptidase [Roseateles asaccharophilus]|uniref:hypothetical protein n=1 Tax=Roseateles asaccharophilus TaxID=582607 RepID=UPI0038363AA5